MLTEYFDIQKIQGEEFISQSISPDNKYTIAAYLNNGGAITDYSVLRRLGGNEAGREKYLLELSCNMVEINRSDNDTIIINDTFLDVPNQVYDFRKN